MVRYTKLMVILIAMTLVPVIYTAEPSSSADCRNLGLLEVLSDEMLNAQIAPYLSLQDIACVRQTCRYLSKHFWDHERVLELSVANLRNKFKVNVAVEVGRLLSLRLMNYYNPLSIDLSSSDLTCLPAEIRQLTWLKRLFLDDNGMSQQAIRDICFGCTQLEELDLSGNKLTELPAEMQQLKRLKILYLWRNNLNQVAREQIGSWLPNTDIVFQ